MDHMAAKGTTKASRSGSDPVTGAFRLVRDAWTILADGIWWLCRALWRFNRAAVRIVLPGQSRPVHATVAALAVLLEVVFLWLAAATYLATH
jgi:hypothetical protein